MKKSTVRTIFSIDLVERDGEIEILYCGNGFLQNMVRILTGTLIEVGRGERAPESMPALLKAKERKQAGYTAPPQGLRLEKVTYVVGHKYCHFLCFCPRNLIDSGNTVITGQNCIHTIFFRLL